MKRVIAVTLAVQAVLGLSGSSAQKQSLDGVWRSEGYGMAFDIHGATLESFEVTATTCVPSDAAQREDSSVAGREATFKTTDGDEFFIRSGGTGDHRILHNIGSVSDVRLDRIPRLPETCEQRRLRLEGASLRQIAATLGVGYGTVRLRLAQSSELSPHQKPILRTARTRQLQVRVPAGCTE
jgi:hypothetical protein